MAVDHGSEPPQPLRPLDAAPFPRMNLRIATVFLLLAGAACATARAESWGGGISGLFLTVDGGAQVSVSKAPDGTYSGKIVWLRDDKDRLDKNNPDPTRAVERVLGLVILKGFRANDETRRWEGGTIYDPKNGKTYDGYIWRDPDRPGTLFLKGYVLGIRWLGRSTTWTEEKKLRE
jgi:uncharacterized protein (DUF2147 family)